jgi:uncharacterized membrane protein YfcA
VSFGLALPPLLVLVGTFAGAFASGLSGFAFTLIAFGFWLHVLPPSEAVPLALLLGIVSQAYSTFRLRDGIRYDLLWPFLVGGVLGVPFGPALLKVATVSQFRIGVGLLLVCYSSFMLFRPPLRPVRGGGRLADGAVGALGGFFASAAGLTGTPPTIWCGLRGWPKDDQRGVYQPYVLVIHSLAIAALGGGISFSEVVVNDFAVCFPLMVVGTVLGLALYGKLDEAQFRRMILWLLLVSGVLLVAAV